MAGCQGGGTRWVGLAVLGGTEGWYILSLMGGGSDLDRWGMGREGLLQNLLYVTLTSFTNLNEVLCGVIETSLRFEG